jgi:hypothetical protein
MSLVSTHYYPASAWFQLFCIQQEEKELVEDQSPVHHLNNPLSLTGEIQLVGIGTTSGKK